MMFLKIMLPLSLAIASFASCDTSGSNTATAATAAKQGKDTCDDPDANINCSFLHMPAQLTFRAIIPDHNSTAARMIIRGRLLNAADNSPIEGAIMYFYHTDEKGYYTKSGMEAGAQKWHGKHHGWCVTGKNGEYELQTIRPAPYPGNSAPAHIHTAIREKEKPAYYINDFVFADDPLVNNHYLNSLRLTGGKGVVQLTDSAGVLVGVRDILVGNK